MENEKKLWEAIKEAEKRAEKQSFNSQENVWEQLENRISKDQTHSRLLFWKRFGIAASVLLFLSITFQWYKNDGSQTDQIQESLVLDAVDLQIDPNTQSVEVTPLLVDTIEGTKIIESYTKTNVAAQNVIANTAETKIYPAEKTSLKTATLSKSKTRSDDFQEADLQQFEHESKNTETTMEEMVIVPSDSLEKVLQGQVSGLAISEVQPANYYNSASSEISAVGYRAKSIAIPDSATNKEKNTEKGLFYDETNLTYHGNVLIAANQEQAVNLSIVLQQGKNTTLIQMQEDGSFSLVGKIGDRLYVHSHNYQTVEIILGPVTTLKIELITKK